MITCGCLVLCLKLFQLFQRIGLCMIRIPLSNWWICFYIFKFVKHGVWWLCLVTSECAPVNDLFATQWWFTCVARFTFPFSIFWMGFKHFSIFDRMTSYNFLQVFVSFKYYKRIVLICFSQLRIYSKNIPIVVNNFTHHWNFSIVRY